MARRVIKRGAFLGLVPVGLVLLTAQKSVTSGAESGLSKLLQALQPKSATAAASTAQDLMRRLLARVTSPLSMSIAGSMLTAGLS